MSANTLPLLFSKVTRFFFLVGMVNCSSVDEAAELLQACGEEIVFFLRRGNAALGLLLKSVQT
jgi:hypothetical protein